MSGDYNVPMVALVLVVALLLVIPGVPPTLAVEIEPDRPELTESAKLVPRGAVQLESGLAFSRERRAGLAAKKTFEAEADLRIGVSRHIELNLGWEPLVRVRGPEDDTGIGDVALGVRYRFVKGFEDVPWPPHLAVKVFAKLPAAHEPRGPTSACSSSPASSYRRTSSWRSTWAPRPSA